MNVIYPTLSIIHYTCKLTDFVARRRAGGRRPFIVIGRNSRPSDLQERVHREPLGVFGRVLVLGPAVRPADGGALFTEHVQGEITFKTHTKFTTVIE